MKILKLNEWVQVDAPKYYTTTSLPNNNASVSDNGTDQMQTKKLGSETVIAKNNNIHKIVEDAIRKLGNDADLNFIDTSNVTDMYAVFAGTEFNGDISKWDVSNVTSMKKTFMKSKFNGDISNWNVSNVVDMESTFENSEFNGDISKWDVSNVETFLNTFLGSKFNNDISGWDVRKCNTFTGMFYASLFNGDLSKWRPDKNEAWMRWMFENSKFDGDISSWNIQYEKEDERYKDMFNEFKTLKTKDMFKNSPLSDNPPKWYIPHYEFAIEETDNIPSECIDYIVSNVSDFRKRYQDNLDSIDGWGTPLKREDPEFFKELLDAANEWLKQNNEGYTARPKDITDVFDPNASNF